MFLLWPKKIWPMVILFDAKSAISEIETMVVGEAIETYFLMLLIVLISFVLSSIIPFFLLPIFLKEIESNFYRRSSYLFFLPIGLRIGRGLLFWFGGEIN
jgi:hypothetical protein